MDQRRDAVSPDVKSELGEWGVGPVGSGLLHRFPTTPATSDEVMRANMRLALARGLPTVRPCHAHDGVLSVAAGGPSLADTWQDMEGAVAAVNGSLDFLVSRGLKPWGCGVLDPGSHMPAVVGRHEGVHYFLASICDPGLFDHLDGMSVGLWHPSGVPGMTELLHEARPDGWLAVSGGTTMGLRWLNLGYTLGFRHFELHGFDSSYRAGATHAYPDHTDGNEPLTIDGYRTKLAFVRQVHEFFVILEAFNEMAEPITVEMHGDGWLQDRWREFRVANPDAFRRKEHGEADEARKYWRMWEREEYRRLSPGEELAPLAYRALGMDVGDSVIDFGCGPGRATALLKAMGCDVLGVDIAGNCLDAGVDVPLRVACLWDLPEDIEGDYGICCDVMEHIPPERVDAVLAGIRKATGKGAFFNISFQPDAFGPRTIGEPLHLTVRHPRWWFGKLKQHWRHVAELGGGAFAALS